MIKAFRNWGDYRSFALPRPLSLPAPCACASSASPLIPPPDALPLSPSLPLSLSPTLPILPPFPAIAAPSTVFYFLRACRNHPSIPLITAVTFSLLVFGSLYAIILLGQQTASESRAETEALAKELAQSFSSQLENSLLYAYSLSSYALNVQEVGPEPPHITHREPLGAHAKKIPREEAWAFELQHLKHMV
jgi:hypothetical protein